MPVFRWKCQRSRSQDIKNHRNMALCSLTGSLSSFDGSGADCKLGLTVVRPNLLSMPETLGNWRDGPTRRQHMSCCCLPLNSDFLLYWWILRTETAFMLLLKRASRTTILREPISCWKKLVCFIVILWFVGIKFYILLTTHLVSKVSRHKAKVAVWTLAMVQL